MDPQSLVTLQRLFLKEGRSLLQYVSEADLYATPKERRALDLVKTAATEERDGLARIARFLHRHHALPKGPASYPMSFTTINFVSLDHLLPYLLDFEAKSIHELHQAIAEIKDADVVALLREYLEIKERHRKRLGQSEHETEPATEPHPHPPAHQ